jgi:DNA mismatch endonuclease (patch repair protein)
VPDVLTPEQRSYNMSRIRWRDTGPEINLRKAIWSRGYRYRLRSVLPGHPDIVFPKQQVAVFVDGCFWHGCPEHSVKPQTNKAFWLKKIGGNIQRDKKINLLLQSDGWTVVRIWEHEIRQDLNGALERVVGHLR